MEQNQIEENNQKIQLSYNDIDIQNQENELKHQHILKKNIKDASFDENIKMINISFELEGPDEDRYYLEHPELLNVYRRGYTQINYNDSNFIGRKGLQKFFDLKIEFLNDQNQLDQINQITKEQVLGNLKEFPVRIIMMEKANGENCQISYIEQFKSFIICSKNISILCRDKDDIQQYTDSQFTVAKLIAEKWFQIYENIQEKDKLLKILDKNTFIGEYCGNQLYQHLVYYKNIDLIFYSIVNKNQNQNCYLVEKSIEIFKKFNLSSAKYEDFGYFDNMAQLIDKLKELTFEINQGSIEKYQEGVVIYFENNNNNIKLCKLKTLEYRIYRKLREKIKSLGHIDSQQCFTQYKDEINLLCKKFKTNKKLDYYFQIAKIAIDFGKKIKKEKQKFLSEKFIQFLSIVINCQKKDKEPLYNMLYNNELYQEIIEKSWSSYYDENENYQQNSENQSIKQAYVIIPISIPGSGKSYFFQYLYDQIKSQDINIQIISSDQCRKEKMDEMYQKNNSLTRDELFDKSTKSASNLFELRIREFLKNCGQKKNLLILDKNHPPEAITKVNNNLKDYEDDYNIPIKKIFICQKIEYFQFSKNCYPFSVDYMLACIMRVFNRKNHETLTGGNIKCIEIMNFFINLYRDFNFNVDNILEVQFIKVQKQNYSKQLINSFKNYISKKKIEQFYELIQNENIGELFPEESILNEQVQMIFKIIKEDKNKNNDQKQKQNNFKKVQYLALDIIDKDFKSFVQDFIDNNQINDQNLIFVDSFHITLLIAYTIKEKLEDNQIYKQFIENQEENVKINNIIYIPNTILIAQVKDLKSQCNNQYPHITLMFSDKFRPKMSNKVMESIQDKLNSEQKFQNLKNVKIDKDEFNVQIFKIKDYIVKTQQKIHFDK